MLKRAECSRLHIALQDDAGAYFIHESLVLPVFLLQSGIEHGAMGKHRGEPFVHHLNGYVGEHLLQPVDEGGDAPHVFGVFARILPGQSHHNAFNLFTLHIVGDEGLQLRRRHGGQSVGNDLQRVSHGQSRAFLTVVNG